MRWATRSHLVWALAAIVFAFHLKQVLPMIIDAAQGDPGAGVDFKSSVFGPNQLVSDGRDPWALENSVPRFGVFPASPIAPSSYLAFPVLVALGFTATLTAWLILSTTITILGSRAICRSLGMSREASVLIAMIVARSTVSAYNISLGQTGAGVIAAVAFFAVRAHPSPRWWHRPEAWMYAGSIGFLFAKPTFALTFLAADLAYRRSARLFAKFAAVIAVLSVVGFAVIMIRSNSSLADLLGSMREAGTNLGNAPVNRMDGDRIDLLSLIRPSPALDVIALAAATLAVVLINRIRTTTLHQRLTLGLIAVTALTYHHVYDTMPLLAVLTATVALWSLGRGVVLAVGLVISGWIDGVGPVIRGLTDLISIEWFVLQARLMFVLSVAVAIAIGVELYRGRSRSVTAQ